jgi:hypothetical protein
MQISFVNYGQAYKIPGGEVGRGFPAAFRLSSNDKQARSRRYGDFL